MERQELNKMLFGVRKLVLEPTFCENERIVLAEFAANECPENPMALLPDGFKEVKGEYEWDDVNYNERMYDFIEIEERDGYDLIKCQYGLFRRTNN